MMMILTGAQTRQLIDCEQVYAVYRAADREYRQRFTGAMSWKKVRGREYLYRKKDGAWVSLGPRSPETEQSYDRFHSGRAALKARRQSLGAAINEMAPVNRAMRLGRVPWTSARILRRLDRRGLLGRRLRVAGTHALYAYERMGGVQFASEALATIDIDLLFDARSAVSLWSPEAPGALVDVLRSVDRSFAPTEAGSFRAVNDVGFMVDLITPLPGHPAVRAKSQAARAAGDLNPVEIEGLTWLESSPSVEQIVIDERGCPLTIVAPDPRAFALHKAWLSRRDDRDPVKRRRDRLQARAVAAMLVSHLPHLRFDDPALKAVPAALRELGAELVAQACEGRDAAAEWDED